MTDWVEVTALIAGPAIAVGLTLWREKGRQERERRLGVMRQLLLTRADASDPAFSTAINLVPIEFGHVDPVMTAWETFTHAAEQNDAKPEHINDLAKQMMLALGYSDRAASQVARTAYMSVALSEQRSLLSGVLRGIVGIARASTASAHASVTMAEHVTGKPLPPIPPE